MDKYQVLKKLQDLSENELVEQIILPLLDKFDFESVQPRHGHYEKGVDILCIKQDELLETELLAIQVKKLKFSGQATKEGHLHGLINQLSQCLEEPIKLKDGTQRYASRVWMISPFQLNVSALEVSFEKYLKAKAKRISIVDGEKLISLVHNRAPELLAKLGDRYSLYIENFKKEIVLLHEASAFRIKEKLSLIPFYINLGSSVIPEQLLCVLNGQLVAKVKRETEVGEATLDSYRKFNDDVYHFLGVRPFQFPAKRIPSPKKTQRTLLKKPQGKSKRYKLKMNGKDLVESVLKKTRPQIRLLEQNIRQTDETFRKVLIDFNQFLCKINKLLQHEAISSLTKRNL